MGVRNRTTNQGVKMTGHNERGQVLIWKDREDNYILSASALSNLYQPVWTVGEMRFTSGHRVTGLHPVLVFQDF